MSDYIRLNISLTEENYREQTYEKTWTFSDWAEICQTVDRSTVKIFVIKTGKSPEVYAKWQVGFEMQPVMPNYRVTLKLSEQKGYPDGKVHAKVMCVLFLDNNVEWHGGASAPTGLSLNECMTTGVHISVNPASSRQAADPDARVCKFRVALKVLEPVQRVDLHIRRFWKKSYPQMRANFASLIGDKDTADLKIVTSDGKELLAHKLILKAQCPVFEAMFRSDLSENQTGVVDVKDINAKTMGIFLHLFYSGDLLPTWKDPDTVVELTYAAAKYQLKKLLELLDKMLGIRDELDASHVDIQLLDLARKLELKVAEKDLMIRIKKSVNKMNSGAEFFALSVREQ